VTKTTVCGLVGRTSIPSSLSLWLDPNVYYLFTRVRHLSTFWIRRIQSTPWRPIHFMLSSCLPVGFPNAISSSGFLAEIGIRVSSKWWRDMSVRMFSLHYFLFISWGGVRLSSPGTSATICPIIIPALDDRWWWVWSSRWNENWQGKPKYSEKTCPSAALCTTNPIWSDLGSNPGRHGGKPATNLSYGTAIFFALTYRQTYLFGMFFFMVFMFSAYKLTSSAPIRRLYFLLDIRFLQPYFGPPTVLNTVITIVWRYPDTSDRDLFAVYRVEGGCTSCWLLT
jgi:hypothetical protein